MSRKNRMFNVSEIIRDNLAISKAEAKRLSWHLEHLKVVRVGRFQNNLDEMLNGKRAENTRALSV